MDTTHAEPQLSLKDGAWRRDLVTSVVALWLVGGLFADGWAHLNQPGLETFFTPWHGALYSGLVAMVAWIGWLAWRGRRAAGSLLSGLPTGYRAAALGAAVFAAGGLADMVWHEIFGVEVAVDALLSPSHLVLLTGGILLLSTGWRAQRAASPGQATLPEVLSLAATAALAAFFLSYTSAFAQAAPTTVFHPTPEGTPGHLEAELPVIAALGGYLVTTALISVSLLLTIRSGRRPRGLVTVLVGGIAWLTVAMMDLPAVLVSGAIGATAGAASSDLLLARVRPERSQDSYTMPAVAAAVAVLVWTGQLAGFAVADALRWPVTLWSGVVVLSALAAAAVGLQVRPVTAPVLAGGSRDTDGQVREVPA